MVSAPTRLLDEERWISAARLGEVEAFNRLVERYEAAAYNLALRAMGNAEDAADATQEAFFSAFRSIAELRGGSFKAWLLRIVLNACRDLQRYQRRRPAMSMELLVEEADGEAPWADPGSPDPEAAALAHESRQRMEQILSNLPDEQRLAIVLVDLQALSYEEAAQVMDCPIGTVRSRLARGRARIRDRVLAMGNLS